MKGIILLLEIAVWIFLLVVVLSGTASESDYVLLVGGVIGLVLHSVKRMKDK